MLNHMKSCLKVLLTFENLVHLAISWLRLSCQALVSGHPCKYLAIVQNFTNLDIFIISTMSRSWQNLLSFVMFLIEVYQISSHWEMRVAAKHGREGN